MPPTTLTPSFGRRAIPISKLGQRRQVVIPKEICEELGLQVGDFVEVTSAAGKVVIKPKKIVDADDILTPAQRAVIDKGLAEAEEDIRAGRVYGPFDSADAMLRSLRCCPYRVIPPMFLATPSPPGGRPCQNPP
jgi:AbrB family looped-hinge helix DNA binding protein